MILHFTALALCVVGSLAVPTLKSVDPRLSLRIVEGGNTDDQEYPYIVSVHYKDRYVCAGVIIHNEYVITAAHCVFTYPHGSAINKDDFKIIGGSNVRTTGHTIVVEEVFVNDNYKKEPEKVDPMLNDIALIKITDITVNSPTNPLEEGFINIENTAVTETDTLHVIGWGSKKAGGEFEDKLRKVPTKWINTANCQDIYGKSRITDGKQICAKAGTDDKPAGICYGDSGGPLIKIGATGTPDSLVGIVSWGTPCARKNKPDVFSSVIKAGAYYNWIQGKCSNCLPTL